MDKVKDITRPINYKAVAMNVKADQDTRKVSGYLAAFGNVDSDRDIILKGAFSKSIQEHGPGSASARKIAYLFQHDLREPIGRFTELKEDDAGLYFEAEIDATARGEQVLKQYASGTLNQHSIGFRYISDKLKYDSELEAWLVGEVQLLEGSVVTIGANENTPFLGFKAEDLEDAAATLREDTERAVKALDPEAALSIRQLITRHIALATAEPAKPLPPEGEPQGINFDKLIKAIQTNPIQK